MKNRVARLLGGLLLLVSLAGQAGATEKLRVLTSFLPIYAHTKSITGDLADVQMLIDKDADPHDYQFKPSDVKKLAQADMFIINGVGLESWLGDLLKKTANPNLVVVDTSQGIDLLDNPTTFFRGSATAEEEEGHDHGNKNPHIWLDPELAEQQVKTILAALVKRDPAHAAAYQKNAEEYLVQLDRLLVDYRKTLYYLSDKDLITFHDAFPYLAKSCGLNYLGCVAQFPEQDPKPAELKKLVELIQQHHVKIIFTESGYSPKLLQEIARQTGAKIAELDTLEIGEPAADAYLVRMKKNLVVLTEAWQP